VFLRLLRGPEARGTPITPPLAGSGARTALPKSLAHPADRSGANRGPFAQFAERASFLASSPLFFCVCASLILVWLLGYVVGFSDRLENAAIGAMSALTLILVALVKNAELRAERALQQKLDAIAVSLLEERRGHDGDAENRLEESIGIHEEI
jgi:low affinity Fe/Cu permease